MTERIKVLMVLYFANPTGSPAVHAAQNDGALGYIDTPEQGNVRPSDVVWCADNGCFGKRFNEQRWWRWLEKHAADAPLCLFATAPDVVGNAAATLERSAPWLPRIRALGYRAAFVAQDGQEHLLLPWNEFDVLFIGGTTAWKLGAATRQLVAEARQRGKWVHCGRVNSLKRYRAMESIGCDSCDGTFLTYGPETNLPRLMSWLRDLHEQPALFDFKEHA
jgi:hypothetical protein